jgi:hypothetical protein
MKMVAQFDPPDAQAAAQEWRQRHAPTLAALPADVVRIDTGRALDGGHFVRILVDEEYAQRFTED